jgi:hypothetical protein
MAAAKRAFPAPGYHAHRWKGRLGYRERAVSAIELAQSSRLPFILGFA